MSIKAKQVAGVTTLVVVIVAVLSAYHLATLARLSLQETRSRGDLLAQAVFQRSRAVVALATGNPYAAIRHDGGVRSILEVSVGYSPYVTYAAVVGTNGVAVAHSFPSEEGKQLPEQEDLSPLVDASALDQLRAVYSDRTFEIRQPMLAGERQFGTVRIGVSTLLVRSELQQAFTRALGTVLAALLISSLVAMLLAQWMLRPILVIQSGLRRLGRGELDVRLDLPETEFKDLGSSFMAVSAQLAALGRAAETSPQKGESRPAGQVTELGSVMDSLEDAVALFAPSGELIFGNSAMAMLISELGVPRTGRALDALPATHPIRHLVEQTLAGRKSNGPMPLAVGNPESRIPDPESRPGASPESRPSTGSGRPELVEGRVPNPDPDRLVMCHAIVDANGRFIGAMLVVRNLGYLARVHSMLNYSRKLAALGRLMAGVAHEVKNPLNAMTIHLELLSQKLNALPQSIAPPAGKDSKIKPMDVTKHAEVIGREIKRLDQIVVGFLKFARPEELKLQPVRLRSLASDVVTTVSADPASHGITMKVECPDSLPEINADPGMLRQALLNLAINACHAMPGGGTLRITCRAAPSRRVEIDVEDTGIGIPPEHLDKIFDLYFTTKKKGSGIGLSMVYRIVQLHDGEVEVQSTPGQGTRFRLVFPQA